MIASTGIIVLCILASGEHKTALAKEYGSVICVTFSPDGRTLGTGHRNGTIVQWQADSEVDVRQCRRRDEPWHARLITLVR